MTTDLDNYLARVYTDFYAGKIRDIEQAATGEGIEIRVDLHTIKRFSWDGKLIAPATPDDAER